MKEILATFHQYFTKEGLPITFKWFHNKDANSLMDERGWIVHKLEAFVDKKKAGYLNISYIPKKNWEKRYPTIWHWLANNKNILNKKWLKNMNNRDLLIHGIGMHLGDIVSYQKANEVYEKSKNTSKMLPKEYLEWAKERETLLSKFRKYHLKEYQRFKKELVDKPLVDYIRVDTNFQRKGVALALYQEGARRMAEKGLSLYASSLQQPEATKAWDKMRTLKKIPLSTETDSRTRTKIDYTTRFNKNRKTAMKKKLTTKQRKIAEQILEHLQRRDKPGLTSQDATNGLPALGLRFGFEAFLKYAQLSSTARARLDKEYIKMLEKMLLVE